MLALFAALTTAMNSEFILQRAESPIDNPLKGLVPYVGQAKDFFPCSMEFSYLPLDKLVTGKSNYDWRPIEDLLEDIRSRGRQTVLRIYLEYPGEPPAIPDYLLKAGLKTTKWQAPASGIEGPQISVTPDYSDPRLLDCLTQFINEFGKKYDGDTRLGFITMGLLGSWGEWHTWPREELFASKKVQEQTIDAFEKSFKTTPILMRYASGPNSEQAENVTRNVGYHDDSFAWATLHTGKKEDEWFFQTMLKAAKADQKWKSHPIGGEIRPEAWGSCFDAKPSNAAIQDFETCVRQIHPSWLLDSGMFKQQSAERVKQASKMVRLMGYDFHVSKVSITGMNIQVTITNQGAAPFYASWPLQLKVVDSNYKTIEFTTNPQGLRGILPGQTVTRKFTLTKSSHGSTILLGCENPMNRGKPLKFANQSQDKDVKGWLTIGNL